MICMRQKRTLADVLADQTLEPKQKYKWYVNSSSEWKQIRDIVLDRDEHRCRCCGRTAEEAPLSVHHSEYTHLFDEQEHLEDLITLCKYCHSGIHRVPSNRQRFKMNNNL